MFHSSMRRIMLLAVVLLIPAATATAAQRALVSSMKKVRAVTESRGYFIVPAHESAGRVIPGDEAPTQAFEIVRPSSSRVTLGRLFTSCSCIQLESPKATFEKGERIVLTLRNVRPTPPGGQTYAVYVQLTSPVRATLRYDTFVQSDRFVASKPAAVAEVPAPHNAGHSEPEAGTAAARETVSSEPADIPEATGDAPEIAADALEEPIAKTNDIDEEQPGAASADTEAETTESAVPEPPTPESIASPETASPDIWAEIKMPDDDPNM